MLFIPMYFILQISQLYHTLSKVLDLYKKTPLTSKGGLQSKDA